MNQVRKDILNGWKEIATYVGRDIRTVERWEKQRGLPIRRVPGEGRATVSAVVSELDAWFANPSTRNARTASSEQVEPAAPVVDEVAKEDVLPQPETVDAVENE